MNCSAYLIRLALILPAFATVCVWTSPKVFAQDTTATFISPTKPVERGKAPGMKVQLLSENNQTKEYAVIFSKGDEAFSGLLDFADKYGVKSAHFTAIGALQGAILAWLDPEKMMYREIRVDGQVEVLSMVGDIALYQGKPAVHTHMVVGLADGTARGGHVIEAHVFPTLEVMVTVDSNAMQKKLDKETGLILIDPDFK
jgi:predicted DNA-binding protein with PD1-like motif